MKSIHCTRGMFSKRKKNAALFTLDIISYGADKEGLREEKEYVLLPMYPTGIPKNPSSLIWE